MLGCKAESNLDCLHLACESLRSDAVTLRRLYPASLTKKANGNVRFVMLTPVFTYVRLLCQSSKHALSTYIRRQEIRCRTLLRPGTYIQKSPVLDNPLHNVFVHGTLDKAHLSTY